MKTTLLIIILALTFTGSDTCGQSSVIDQDVLNVSALNKSSFEIRTPQNLPCEITVKTHKETSVRVDYNKWVKAKTQNQKQRFAELIEVYLDDLSKHPDVISLRILTPTRAPWEGTENSAGVKLEIRVPEYFNIGSHSSYSTVKLVGPFEKVKTYNEYGSVEIDSVIGALIVKASNSKVKVSHVEGSISVETGYAEIKGNDIVIINGTGMFETSHGSIDLKNIRGAFEAHTSYDYIRVSDIDAGQGSVVLTTSYAPITGEDITGELVCETSYNPVNLTNINLTHGMNKIETIHAPVNVTLNELNEAQLIINNTYSSINVFLESDISAKLLLAVDEGGRIHTRGFSIKPLAMDSNRLVGITGDGLSNIELNVDGIGEINIEGK